MTKEDIPGITFTGPITVNGPMFDIHDNEHIHFNVTGKPVTPKKATTKKKPLSKPPKPRETMTFQPGKGVLEGHLSMLFKQMADDGLIEGNEADFKALFSKKMNSNCLLIWTNKYGKGTLVELFKRLAEEGLIIVPDGFTLTAILEGHFQDSDGKWITGLDKGNKANKKAAPLIDLCVKTLKADPKDLINSMQQDDGYFRSEYDSYDHQDLHLRKHL